MLRGWLTGQPLSFSIIYLLGLSSIIRGILFEFTFILQPD
jgi:hypothetical protein